MKNILFFIAVLPVNLILFIVGIVYPLPSLIIGNGLASILCVIYITQYIVTKRGKK